MIGTVNCELSSLLSNWQTKRVHLPQELGVGGHVIRTIPDLRDDKSNFIDVEVTGLVQERINQVKAGLTVGAKRCCATGHHRD